MIAPVASDAGSRWFCAGDVLRRFLYSVVRSQEPGLLEAVRFLWNATRGHRMKPWRSEYLRWRLETYTGKPASEVQPRDFWELFAGDKKQFFRFLAWTGEMKSYADGKGID